MPDNDGAALKQLGYILGDLQDKYRDLTPLEREEMRPKLDAAFSRYQEFRILLLGPGVLISNDDLAQMKAVGNEIEKAADKESLIEGAIKLATFFRSFLV
jgi:hypothetical protein